MKRHQREERVGETQPVEVETATVEEVTPAEVEETTPMIVEKAETEEKTTATEVEVTPVEEVKPPTEESTPPVEVQESIEAKPIMEEATLTQAKATTQSEATPTQPITPPTEKKSTPPPSTKGRKSKKRPAEGDANPIDKKAETLSLANLKLRIQYAFKKWNPKWMRRLKAVNEKLDKMAKTPEEGFKEMCVM